MFNKFLYVCNFAIFCIVIAILIVYTNLGFSSKELGALSKIDITTWLICISLYLLAHMGRLLRLMVIIIEHNRAFHSILQLYALLAQAGFVLPFKLGELFRITELSHFFGSFKTGFSVVVVERFFDAMMLLFLLLMVDFLGGVAEGGTPIFIPFLIILVLLMFIFYFFFSKTCQYFRCLVLSSSGSQRGVIALQYLNFMEAIYTTFRNTIRGRPLLLIVLSLGIWCAEIYNMIYFLAALSETHEGIGVLSKIYGDILIGRVPSFESNIYISVMFFILFVVTCIPLCLYVFQRIRSIFSENFFKCSTKKRYALSSIQFYYKNLKHTSRDDRL